MSGLLLGDSDTSVPMPTESHSSGLHRGCTTNHRKHIINRNKYTMGEHDELCARELRQLTELSSLDYLCVHPNRPGATNLCEGNQEANIDIFLDVNWEIFH